jgi:hypothetical protein
VQRLLFRGRYEVLVFGKRRKIDRIFQLRIPSQIDIRVGKGRILLFPSAKVEVYAESLDELHRLKVLVEIAISRATGWMDYRLDKLDEFDLTSGKRVRQAGGFDPDFSIRSFVLDKKLYHDTVIRLGDSSYESILFLGRANDFLRSEHAEVASFSALTALELELNRAIPTSGLQIRQKLEVLRFLQRLQAKSLDQITALYTLRNKLAHGDWTGKRFVAILAKALGGPQKHWTLRESNRMSTRSSERIVEAVIDLLPCVSGLSRPLRDQKTAGSENSLRQLDGSTNKKRHDDVA